MFPEIIFLEGLRNMTILRPDPLFISQTGYRGCKIMAQASTTEPLDTLARIVVQDTAQRCVLPVSFPVNLLLWQ